MTDRQIRNMKADDKDKVLLIESKKNQIKEILMEGDITFGMAKSIIQAVEVDILSNGNTFLNKSKLTSVFPSEI